MANAPDEIISAYVQPVPEGQPKGGIVTWKYDPNTQRPIGGAVHADDDTTEVALTSIKENMDWSLTREPPITGRTDIAYCNVQCTVLEACREDEQDIVALTRVALDQLLHGKSTVNISSSEGKYGIYGTSHAKPKAA